MRRVEYIHSFLFVFFCLSLSQVNSDPSQELTTLQKKLTDLKTNVETLSTSLNSVTEKLGMLHGQLGLLHANVSGVKIEIKFTVESIEGIMKKVGDDPKQKIIKLMALFPEPKVAVIQQEVSVEAQNAFVQALQSLSKEITDPEIKGELKQLAEKVKKTVTLNAVKEKIAPVLHDLGVSSDDIKDEKKESFSSSAGGSGAASAGDGKVHDIFISLVEGDITKQRFLAPATSAIVNAANGGLMGGGGVDAAVHGAAGSSLLKAANAGNRAYCNGSLADGGAVITESCNLKEKFSYIIHTVGPAPYGDPNSSHVAALTNAYMHSLEFADIKDQADKRLLYGLNYDKTKYDEVKKTLAVDPVISWNGLTAIAFTAISTGIFDYNVRLATPVAFEAVFTYLKKNPKTNLREIRFVTYGKKSGNPSFDYNVYNDELDKLLDTYDEKKPVSITGFKKILNEIKEEKDIPECLKNSIHDVKNPGSWDDKKHEKLVNGPATDDEAKKLVPRYFKYIPPK